MLARMEQETILVGNRLHVIQCTIMIISTLYLHYEQVLETWTNLMMNGIICSMYILPFITKQIPCKSNNRRHSLTMGSENDENVF